MGAREWNEECRPEGQAFEHLAHAGGAVWRGLGSVVLLEEAFY